MTVATTGSVETTIWHDPPTLTSEQLAITDWPLLSAILQGRGITSRDDANAFLQAATAPLADPYLLPDLDRAVALIREALQRDAPIGVFGDYDVDGITSTAMIFRVLTRLGARVIPEIPHRHKDGYGLNGPAVDRLVDAGVDVMVVVDCGSGNSRELEYAISRGLRPIVLDHHLLHGDLPESIPFVSPRRESNRYPTSELAAVGVAFTLVRALLGEADAAMYQPYAALGTVADVVELRGDNRAIVARGLEMLRRWSLPGMRALCDCAEIDRRTLNTWHIGFIIGPRINAAGRMDDPVIALNLLLANDYESAVPFAVQLEELNRKRQAETKRITEEAERMVQDQAGDVIPPVLVVDDPTWSIGLAGIVAGRLAENHNRPAIVFERGPLIAKGSARSGGTVDIVHALEQTAEFLDRFGGHAAAAGLSLPSDKVDAFRDALAASVMDLWGGVLPKRQLYLDAEVPHTELRLETIEALSSLEPTGHGNEPPIFLVRDLQVRSPRLTKDGKHLMFQLEANDGRKHSAIFFRGGERLDELVSAGRVDVACDLNKNEWRGQTSLQLQIHDFRPAK